MAEKLIISGLVKESIVDGPGIRYTVFTQGCPHHCPECHNPQTWPFEGGRETTPKKIFNDFMKNPLLKGITFSGGEPFCQAKAMAELARLVHEAGKDVTVFTGYVYEDILREGDPDKLALLEETDLLIDGPFIAAQKNLELTFRGSENQRLIDMKKTRAQGQIALLEA